MTSQCSLFEPPPSDEPMRIEERVPASTCVLRPYQEEAVARIQEELSEHRGTLCLMATGLGKTQVACEVIRQHTGRCLFVAHRDELIQQAARRIDEFVGGWPDIEQAEDKATAGGSNHVVASIQTLSRPQRLERFNPGEFGLIIVDEVHHGTSPTYRRVIDHFASAKILGLTATPDRLDGEALGQILDSVAYQYELPQAIEDGWLCPIVMKQVCVDSLDFSGIHTLAGDFKADELEALMMTERNLHAVAKPAVECAGERKTLVFTTSVAHAERLAEIIDRYAGAGKACMICGKTPRDERRRLLRAYERGEHQFLVNVAVFTEGMDCPPIACVVQARPTKSRSLYSQMIGRSTRGGRLCPVPGKKDALILDFVGNSGRHDIVCAADILGGKLSDQELAEAKQEIRKSNEPLSIEEATEKARQLREEIQAREDAKKASQDKRRGLTAAVEYTLVESNPYTSLDVRRDYLHSRYGYAKASERMYSGLEKWMRKYARDLPKDLSQTEGRRLLKAFAARAERGLSSYPQMRTLQKFGHDARQWTFQQASSVLNALAKNRWRPLPGEMVTGLTTREPGSDG